MAQFVYHSQDEQDKFLHQHIFKDFKNGVFVDVGAYDGKSINNTLFFENSLNWTGMNVEPLPTIYAKLVQNRPNCINVNCAIDTKTGYALFYSDNNHGTMLSGLVGHYEPQHKERLEIENIRDGTKTSTITVPTQPLQKLLDKHKIPHVHYLSVDVEGAEMAVLQSIDYSKVFIDVIGFEDNYQGKTTQDIRNFLESKGFQFIHRASLDIFMMHKDSKFKYTP